MSIAQLLKILFVGQPFLAAVRKQVWLSVLARLRRLYRLLLSLVCRKWPRPAPPPPPPPQSGKDQGGLDHQCIRSSLTSPSSLSPYTVVSDGEIIPLHKAVFSINPVSPSDSVRNPSPAPSLRHNQHGSQLSLRLPSHSTVSGRNPNSGVRTPSVSSAISRYTPSLYGPDTQEIVGGPQDRPELQLPGRRDTLPGIQVVQPPDDSQTSIQVPGASLVPSKGPVDVIGSNQSSRGKTLHVPDARTSYTHISSGSLYSVTSDEPRFAYDSIEQALVMEGLVSTVPSETRRYKNRKKIKKKKTDIILSPKDCDRKSFHRGLVLPPGWTRLTHPEGGCYFHHSASGIYTDNEIYNPEELKQIEAKMNAIAFCRRAMDDFPSDTHIVLNIYGVNPGDIQYYCVNHADRMIFFFWEFHTEWLQTWGGVEGAYSRHHLLHELEAEYWHFVHLYPDSIKLSKKVIDDLKDDLFFFNGDVTTSLYSTSPYNSVEITNLLNIIPMLEGHIESETSTAGGVEFIARIMMLICHNRFMNFYGEPCARLERDFSVYGNALFPRTFLLRSVSLFLFSAPDVHLKSLQKMWADEMLHQAVWKETMRKFASEWQELVTFATIMLNANVAFLAISSVDNPGPSRSWAQIFSYASTIANLACMILGLLLMKQNRTKRQGATVHVYAYLKKQYSELTGLEALAIMFSLPHASLMWGMVSFSIAFSLMCLRKADVPTRIVVVSCLTLAAVYIIWCIHLAWETNPNDTSQDNRSWAYSQDAELKKAQEENPGNNETSTAGDSETDNTSSRSRSRPRIPGIETVTSLWKAFLYVFVRSDSPDVESGENIEMHNVAPGNHA